MNAKKFSMITKVLCMVAFTILISSPAFSTPVLDGRIDSTEGYKGVFLNLEVEGYNDGGPLGQQGKGGIYGDNPDEVKAQILYHQEGTGSDLYLAIIQPTSLYENVYGPDVVWGTKEHTLDKLAGDKAEISLRNGSSIVFDISFDYLYTDDKKNPTTWGSGLGPDGYGKDQKYDSKEFDPDEGKNGKDVDVYQSDYPGIEAVTSMEYNWNLTKTADAATGVETSPYFGPKPDKHSTDPGPTSPDAGAEPDWIYESIYEIKIDGSLLADYDFDLIDLSIELKDKDNMLGNGKDKVWVQPVPEPATMLLLGTGLIGLAGGFRRKFRKGRKS